MKGVRCYALICMNNGYIMNIYGESLFHIGIVLMVSVLSISAVFTGISLAVSFRLKKQLEKEYGKKDK